jgi:hypothetical protein
MIVGLKYVGAASDIPTSITVGDEVYFRREPGSAPRLSAVAAYHNGRKVGYLSADKHTLWHSMGPSGRRQATVVGEIRDQDGTLAGLDVEIAVTAGPDEQASGRESSIAEKAPWRGRIMKTAIGAAVLLLALAMMGRDRIDPDGPIAAISSMTADKLSGVDRPRGMELTQVVKLTPADQVKYLSMPGDSSEAQALELDRMVRQAYAHRLGADLKRRAELALALQQAETEKTQQLAEDLRQARAAAERHRIEIESLEQRARRMAAYWQAENRKLEVAVTRLQRRMEEMTAAQRKLEEEARERLALTDLNIEELKRHKNRVAAWNVISRGTQAKRAEKTKSLEQQAPNEANAIRVTPAPKPIKQRRKANFSRYAD